MEKIAIIGVGFSLPKTDDLDSFWQKLLSGETLIENVSTSKKDIVSGDAEKVYVPKKAQLDNVGLFDHKFFGYSKTEADITDPQQRLFLTLSHKALENGGYAGTAPENIGVFGGVGGPGYLLNNLLPNRELIESLGDYQIAIGNNKDYVTTSVSNKLNLTGPSINVQTACSTSLVAIHQAIDSLTMKRCDAALAGGVSLSMPRNFGYFYRQGGIMSVDGKCCPFDESASGTVRGEGGVVFLLKLLDKAIEDGDNIHAVICGCGVNNDGNRKAGFTAPSELSQEEVMRMALASADKDVDDIDFVEAHGTATIVGDAIELSSLSKVYGASRDKDTWVGSVKGNYGHLDTAAGGIGLLKAMLVAERGKIPPTANYKSLPHGTKLTTSEKLRINRKPVDIAGEKRKVAVSSFGIGGTNCHLILENFIAPTDQMPSLSSEYIFPVSAASKDALKKRLRHFHDKLKVDDSTRLEEVSKSLLSADKRGWPNRCLLRGSTKDELLKNIIAWMERESQQVDKCEKLSLVFEEAFDFVSANQQLVTSKGGLQTCFEWSEVQLEAVDSEIADQVLTILCFIKYCLNMGVELDRVIVHSDTIAEAVSTILVASSGEQARVANSIVVSNGLDIAHFNVTYQLVAGSENTDAGIGFDSLPVARINLKKSDTVASQLVNSLLNYWVGGGKVSLRKLMDVTGSWPHYLDTHPLNEEVCWVSPKENFDESLLTPFLGKSLLGEQLESREIQSQDLQPDGGESGSSKWQIDGIESKLKNIIQKLLGLEEVDGASDFFEVGGDSLTVIQLRENIVQTFECEVPLAKIIEATSISEQASLIEKALSSTMVNDVD